MDDTNKDVETTEEVNDEGVETTEAEVDETADVETDTADDEEEVNDEGEEVPAVSEVPTAQYKITGLVDFMDEQGNIRGQLPIGSVQTLPIEVGEKAVADGRAELVPVE